jgi:hypothetical protein
MNCASITTVGTYQTAFQVIAERKRRTLVWHLTNHFPTYVVDFHQHLSVIHCDRQRLRLSRQFLPVSHTDVLE